jgi:hypothetical protein
MQLEPQIVHYQLGQGHLKKPRLPIDFDKSRRGHGRMGERQTMEFQEHNVGLRQVGREAIAVQIRAGAWIFL